MPIRSPGTSRRRPRKAKPLVVSFEKVEDYRFSDHAIEQLTARNISPLEVLSTIAQPDTVTHNRFDHDYPEARRADRGDIRVVFDPKARSVLTVIDLDEDLRTIKKPRVALSSTLDGAQIEIKKLSPDNVPTQRKPRPQFEDSEDMAWLLGKHDKPDIRYLKVTPVVAEKLLSMNTRNRPKRARDVNEWADEMAGNRWLVTHQGVAIDRDNAIVDGQHRLEAIVESGVSVTMPVAVGLDPETYKVIDSGRKRTTSDALATNGEKSVHALAAAVKLVYMFDNLWLDGGTRRIHTDMLMAYLEGKEEGFREAVRFASTAPIHGLYMMKTAISAGYYLLHRDVGNTVLVDEFCDGVMMGEMLPKNDPRFGLRRVAANDNKRSAVVHLALWLKAWHKYATDQDARLIVYKREIEDFPILYVPPKTFRRTA